MQRMPRSFIKNVKERKNIAFFWKDRLPNNFLAGFGWLLPLVCAWGQTIPTCIIPGSDAFTKLRLWFRVTTGFKIVISKKWKPILLQAKFL